MRLIGSSAFAGGVRPVLVAVTLAPLLVAAEALVAYGAIVAVGSGLKPYINPESRGDRLFYEGIFLAIIAVAVCCAVLAAWVLGRKFARAPLATALLTAVLSVVLIAVFREGLSALNDCLVGISYPRGHDGGCD